LTAREGKKSGAVRIFSTCAQSRDVERGEYSRRVADVARMSEAAGYEGILVYTDNAILDPWLVSLLVIDATERLSPLVAVQPAYMHPYSVAKMVSSIAYLHGRRIYLNLVAGGFRNDLLALGDETPHDERYERLLEYAEIIKRLVETSAPVSLEGRFYRVRNLRLTPPVPSACIPGMTISGSSVAGLRTARAAGAIAVKYPQPWELEAQQSDGANTESGMRIGIITRASREEAWRVAYERFPEDRAGQISHRLAMQVSDSQWHRQLAELAHKAASNGNPYWLGPFQNYRTFCPYLVGEYDSVAIELRRYLELGFRTFILDIPHSEEDIAQTSIVFQKAQERAGT
jgi:alkanesulfonate monooxygenase